MPPPRPRRPPPPTPRAGGGGVETPCAVHPCRTAPSIARLPWSSDLALLPGSFNVGMTKPHRRLCTAKAPSKPRRLAHRCTICATAWPGSAPTTDDVRLHPKQTMPQRSASLVFNFMDDLASLSVANTNSLIWIGLGAGVVCLCFPEKQGTATFQGRLDASSPRGLGQPVKTVPG